MKQNWFTYNSLIKPITKEILAGEKKQRNKAALHVKAKIKRKIGDVYFEGYHSQPGEPPGKVTGNLLKGVYHMTGKKASFVGTHAPAFHAYLLEFGTAKMRPRPFVYNTFAEESREVERILSEPWIK